MFCLVSAVFVIEFVGRLPFPPFSFAMAKIAKKQVVKLQVDLLAELTASPRTQQRLRKCQSAADRDALARSLESDLAGKQGFDLQALDQALQELSADVEVDAHRRSIVEALHGREDPEVEGIMDRTAISRSALKNLLQTLHKCFAKPSFQSDLDMLKEEATRRGEDPEAPHLAGRDELIFFIQEDLLPKYGFEASKAGVNEMLKLCARHLADPEIARLFDDANKPPPQQQLCATSLLLWAIGDLDGIISGLWGLKVIPQVIRDWGYELVAKSRFMLLGHASISEEADDSIKARMVDTWEPDPNDPTHVCRS
ncbi:unnamed protein product [Effrenium voratum]|nr:unnamed protein product [Effrenium voratum]